MRTWKSLFAASLLVGGAACGDDSHSDDHDANPFDASNIDAMIDATPAATRSATIAVADVTLTSADAVARGMRGGSISIEFSDITSGGGEVVHGTSPIGGCVVQRFDADGTPNGPNPPVDSGGVIVSGPETGDSGLLKAVGPCGYVQGMGYICSSHNSQGLADQMAVVTDLPNSASSPPGLIAYTFSEQTFPASPGVDLVGAYLTVDGFANAAFNSPVGQAFPIVAQQGTTTLVAFNPAGEGQTDIPIMDASFTVLNGFAPAPVGPAGDFLGDETTSVRIQKAADAEWPAIDFTTYTRGEGFDLDDDSDQPHEFPATAAAMAFSCAGTGGNCGAEGTAALEAIIISGRTTDTPVSGLPLDFLMPPATTEYATFQCGYLLADSGSIPEAAVQAILDTNPTRVEIRVLRVAGAIVQDGLNEGRILVGHGLVGHTTL